MHKKSIKILLSPIVDLLYYGWYISGMKRVAKINGYSLGFMKQDVIPPNLINSKYLFYTIEESDRRKTINIIDANDDSNFPPELYKISDAVFKVNMNSEIYTLLNKEDRNKLFVIGPSFGIHSIGPLLFVRLLNCAISFRKISNMYPRNTIISYYRQWRFRKRLYIYETRETEKGKVFFAGTYWKKEHEVNEMRANIIRVSRKILNNDFEGGFAPRKEAIQRYPDLVLLKSYPHSVYLKKTRQSPFVFITPGVSNCLGWKLAEFLAMGKAIISYPTYNITNPRLEHGKNIHYIKKDGSDLEYAITKVMTDDKYRSNLKMNASSYYENYLRPEIICKFMLDASLDI
jgi:hypothetical protein